MIGRIVEIAEDGRHLSVDRGFLVVTASGEELGRVPLDDIAALIANGHGMTCSQNILVELARRGAPMVVCAANHLPAAWLWPADGHHSQTARIRAQADAGKPLLKRLWQAIICGKIIQQAAMLDIAGKTSGGVKALARKVRSGDPENIEAQAARRYWTLLMGEDFRRDRARGGANAMLNYGYTVLRAACARSAIAAGLHPSIGIHHLTRNDSFCLASDIMEPFRPLMDLAVLRLVEQGAEEITREVRAALVTVLSADMETARGTTPVSTCIERLAVSIAASFESGKAEIDLPYGILALDAAALGRIDAS